MTTNFNHIRLNVVGYITKVYGIQTILDKLSFLNETDYAQHLIGKHY